jgi:hypothetical protein
MEEGGAARHRGSEASHGWRSVGVDGKGWMRKKTGLYLEISP